MEANRLYDGTRSKRTQYCGSEPRCLLPLFVLRGGCGMTGRELIEKIREFGAEELDVLCITFDGWISNAQKVDVAEDVAKHEKKLVIT